MTKKREVDIYALEDSPGIGPIAVEKLDAAGITGKRDVLIAGWIEIAEITGMQRDKAEESVAYCRKVLIDAGDQWQQNMNGAEIYRMREKMMRVSTCSDALDEMFEGGIEHPATTRVAG